jgi:hypothetical protein
MPAATLLLALAALCGVAAAPSPSPHAEHALASWGVASPPRRVLEPTVSLAVLGDGSPLARSGAWVDVAWSGLEAPAADDFVAYHVPADAQLGATQAPVKFQLTKAKAAGTLR